MMMIQVTEDKKSEMSELCNKMLHYGGKLMHCIENMDSDEGSPEMMGNRMPMGGYPMMGGYPPMGDQYGFREGTGGMRGGNNGAGGMREYGGQGGMRDPMMDMYGPMGANPYGYIPEGMGGMRRR